jgi:hypothetical protein
LELKAPLFVVSLPRSERPNLQLLIGAIIESAHGADLPISKLAAWCSRSRSAAHRAIALLRTAGVIVNGHDDRLVLDAVRWREWHGAKQCDPLPRALLGHGSPSVLAAAALLFREARESRPWTRSDRERQKIGQLGVAALAGARALLADCKLAKLSRRLVKMRQGRKALHRVDPLPGCPRLAYSLGIRRETFERWGRMAAGGRIGRAKSTAAPVVFLRDGVAFGARTPVAFGTHHTFSLSQPHDETQMLESCEKVSAKVASKVAQRSIREQYLEHQHSIRRKVGSIGAGTPKGVHETLQAIGVFSGTGAMGHGKLASRRWRLAEYLARSLGNGAAFRILDLADKAAADPKVRNLGAVLHEQCQRLLRGATKVDSAPMQNSPAQELPAVRKLADYLLTASLAGDWRRVAERMASDLAQRLGWCTRKLSDASGIPEATIEAGLAAITKKAATA